MGYHISGNPLVTQAVLKINKYIDKAKKRLGKKCIGIRVKFDDGTTLSRYFDSVAERRDFEDTELQKLLASRNVEKKGEKYTQTYRLSWAIEKYLASGRWRDKTISCRKDRLNKLLEVLGDVELRDIERSDIVRFIETAERNETRKGYSSDAVAFLNWCGNSDQGNYFVEPRKFLRLQWTRLREDEPEVTFLTPEETKEIMDETTPKYKAAMALSFFTGIRPFELSRMTWKDISFARARIIVSGKISKTRKRRVLAGLPDNLWAWLKKYKSTGKIIPSYNALRLSRHRACLRISFDWPFDGARHSFATYGYWRGEEWARRTMGHTEGTRVFHGVYVDAGASEEEAKEYFNIFPPKKDKT